jgi:hypothetical protein
MAKDKLTDYDATAGNNTDIGGISVDEGMLPSNVNNAIREIMSHLKDFAAGTQGVTTIGVDTINETTADGGVTVDGLLIKDKEIGTSAAPATLQASAINGGQIGGRRNVVTNGAMQVAQRSTSVTGIGASDGYFTVDRFAFNTENTSGRLTMTQTADGPSGFANCIKLDCTTADTDLDANKFIILETRFEGQDLQRIAKGTSDAKEFTVSFYVKGNASATYGVEFFDIDNSRISETKSFSVTTGWTRVELTYPADTTGAFDDDNAESLRLHIWLMAGTTYTSGTTGTTWRSTSGANATRVPSISNFFSSTDNTFFITGLQMEVGSVATEFEHRSFGEELALCQRYFSYNCAGTGKATSTTVIQAQLPTIVTMRASPSIAVVNGTGAAGDIGISARNLTGVSGTVDSQLNGVSVQLTCSTTNSGNIHEVYANRISFDAEL